MKQILFLLGILFPLSLVFAQSKTPREQINFQFELLKSSTWLSTQYLYDKAFSAIPLENLHGNKDSVDTLNCHDYRQLLWQDLHALIPIDTNGDERMHMVDSIVQANINLSQHPISIFVGKYDVINSYALDSNLLDTNNFGQFREVGNINQSPYQTIDFFSAGALFSSTTDDTLRLVLPSELIFNHTGLQISSIAFDFGNKDSFIQILPNQMYNFSLQNIQVCISTIKIMFSNTKVVYAKLTFEKKIRTQLTHPDDVFHVTALIPYQRPVCAKLNTGTYGSATYSIKYAYTRSDYKLHKPIIFVEGFDPVIGYDEKYNRHGGFGWDVFTSGGKNGRTGSNDYPNLQMMPDVITTLLTEPYGYDVILVDFKNGGDYIQKNAYALIQIIQDINKMKVGNDELVIVGTSMGGLITRFALSYMEEHNISHCCRLWVTFDSPHNGANIPIGLQSAFAFFGNFELDAKGIVGYLSTPAALQMLIRHRGYTQNKLPIDAACYRLSLPYTFPDEMRKLAIVNGNVETYGQGYLFGENICDFRFNKFGATRIACNIKSQPLNSGIVFYGVYSAKRYSSVTTYNYNEYYNCNPSCINIDGAPGGYTSGVGDIFDKINLAALKNNSNGQTKYKFNNEGFSCFIPSTSALAIKPEVSSDLWYNIKANIPDNQRTYNEVTPFDAYFAPGLVVGSNIRNQAHVLAEDNNMNWLLTQLELDKNLDNFRIPDNGYTIFNAASAYSKRLGSVKVSTGGKLMLNGNVKENWGQEFDKVPKSGLLLRFYTSECIPSTIHIERNAELILGDEVASGVYNMAQFVLKEGSNLILSSGSKVIIHEGSKLTIKKGAKLILDPDVEIILNGTNSILELEGVIQMVDGAVFKPHGSGHCVLINHTGSVSEHFKPSLNNDIIFDGTIGYAGKGTRTILEIKGNYGANISGLNLFEVKNGDVLLDAGNQLELNTKHYYFQNVHFNSIQGPSGIFKGLFLSGSTVDLSGLTRIPAFENVDFSNCEFGIVANLLNCNYGLRLYDVSFYSCMQAIQTSGGYLKWFQGKSEDCGGVWNGSTLKDPSVLIDVSINEGSSNTMYPGIGILTEGNPSADVSIHYSHISHYKTGVKAIGMKLYLKCTNIELNETGVELGLNAHLVLNTMNGITGYSNIASNLIGIQTCNSATIDINEGFCNLSYQNVFNPFLNFLGKDQTLIDNKVFGDNNFYGINTPILNFIIDDGQIATNAPFEVNYNLPYPLYLQLRNENCYSVPLGELGKYFPEDELSDVKFINNKLSSDKTIKGIDNFSADRLNLYPNPADIELNIQGIHKDLVSYEIIDLNGRLIETSEFKRSNEPNEKRVIDTRKFDDGIYVLRLYSDGHKIPMNQRFIIKHRNN